MMNLGNRKMEMTGVHYMGNIEKTPELSEEERTRMMQAQKESELQLAANIYDHNKGIKSAVNKEIVSCGLTVIVKPYDNNPYRSIKTSASGIIYGLDGNAMQFSRDTGEMEESHPEIICAEVIAVGKECKYVQVGEDVYLRNIITPVPFDNRGYYAISEQNIICRIVNKS